MFRDADGNKIQDRDYKRHVQTQTRRKNREAAEAAEKADAIDDQEEVQDRINDLDSEVHDATAFAAYVSNIHGSSLQGLVGTVSSSTLDEIVEGFVDAFMGHWDSEKDYTEHAIEEGLFGEATDGILGQYVDVDALTRDLFISDLYSLDAPDNGVLVFSNH